MKRPAPWLSLIVLLSGFALSAQSEAQTSVTRVEDRDQNVRYATYNWLNSGEANATGRSMMMAYGAGSSVTVTFKGTGIRWIGYRCTCAAGQARVYLDGNRMGTIDTYAAERQFQAEIYRISGLPDREHVFTIEATGDYHRSGSSGYIAVDAFDIENGTAIAPRDTTAPKAWLTDPSSLETLSGPVRLTADAEDDTWLAGVSFLLDGLPFGNEDISAPYSIDWDTTTASEGPHMLNVIARDWNGNTAVAAPVAVRVTNGGLIEESNAAITWSGEWVKFSNPAYSGGMASGAYRSGATATVKFTGTGITWIGYRCTCTSGIARIFLDGALHDKFTTYAAVREPQAAVYRISGLNEGDHTLKIEVTGEFHPGGESAYLIVDGFRVMGGSGGSFDSTAPNVSFTSAYGGKTVQGPIRIDLEASDNVGVAGVRVFANGLPVGSEDTTAPYVAYWDTTTFANGKYTVQALAHDKAGNISLSSTFEATVFNAQDTGRPTARLATPRDGAVLTGNVTLTATALDNVSVVKVRFLAGDLVIGEATSPPWTITRNTSTIASGKSFPLSVQALDAAGNVGVSPVSIVTIQHGGSSAPP